MLRPVGLMSTATAESVYVTSGLVRLTKPQLIRTMTGLLLAALLAAIHQTIVGDIFSPLERGRYQGLFAALWGVASIFGPTLGGWLTDHWSWRACFYVNLPFGAIAVAAIHFEFPHMKPRRVMHQLDWG